MKQPEARIKILSLIQNKKQIAPQEIFYALKGAIALIQIHGIAKQLSKEGLITIEEPEPKKKIFKATDSLETAIEIGGVKEGVGEGDEPENSVPVSKPKYKGYTGRDLSKYTFSEHKDLNKGRLALAIVSKWVKEKKPNLKQGFALWKDEIVKPYGVIKEVKEIKKAKLEKRFFCKDSEVLTLTDAKIAVSSQMTPERISAIIAIAEKQLGYKITKQ